MRALGGDEGTAEHLHHRTRRELGVEPLECDVGEDLERVVMRPDEDRDEPVVLAVHQVVGHVGRGALAWVHLEHKLAVLGADVDVCGTGMRIGMCPRDVAVHSQVGVRWSRIRYGRTCAERDMCHAGHWGHRRRPSISAAAFATVCNKWAKRQGVFYLST